MIHGRAGKRVFMPYDYYLGTHSCYLGRKAAQLKSWEKRKLRKMERLTQFEEIDSYLYEELGPEYFE